MQTWFRWLVAAGIGLSVAACVPEFENALDTGPAADPAVIGVWDAKSENEPNAMRLDITAGENGILLAMRDPIGGSDEMIGFSGRTSESNGVRYVWLTPQDADALGAGGAKVGFFVFRYTVDGETIKVWALDTQKIAAAIENGRLKGTVTGSGTDTATKITATSAELAAFFATEEGQASFAQDGPDDVLILTRAKP